MLPADSVLLLNFPFNGFNEPCVNVHISLFAGITQDQIDELREVQPNEMLKGMQDIDKDGGDLEIRDNTGATPVSSSLSFTGL